MKIDSKKNITHQNLIHYTIILMNVCVCVCIYIYIYTCMHACIYVSAPITFPCFFGITTEKNNKGMSNHDFHSIAVCRYLPGNCHQILKLDYPPYHHLKYLTMTPPKHKDQKSKMLVSFKVIIITIRTSTAP